MLVFTDFFRIQFRIRNVYFGSESDPDPAKSFGSFRIRIRNTDFWDEKFLCKFAHIFLYLVKTE